LQKLVSTIFNNDARQPLGHRGIFPELHRDIYVWVRCLYRFVEFAVVI